MIQFREINSLERDLVRDRLKSSLKFEAFDDVIMPFRIIIAEGEWKEVLLISEAMHIVFFEFKEFRQPYFMGIHLGDIKKNNFKISLEGITLIANHIKEKTILSVSGEKRVLYGRDLSKDNLASIPAGIQENDKSILINENGEVLALGKYLFNRDQIEKSKGNQVVVKNIMDKGWYLRKGK
jgi:60S ribosome subunit biogenesis protein NIP7